MFGISHLGLSLQTGRIWLGLGIFLLAAGLAWYSYRTTNPPVSPAKRHLLMGLRTLAFFLLILAISEPVFSLVRSLSKPPVVALLVDTSKSMSLVEEGKRRLEKVKELMGSGLEKELTSQGRVYPFRFSSGLQPLSPSDSLTPTGKGTAIGDALLQTKKELSGENVVGMVIFSDGQNNLGRDPLQVARGLEIPLFPVGVGSPLPPKDLAITGYRTNEVAYVGAKLPVKATIRGSGFPGQKGLLFLKEGVETLDRVEFPLPSEGGEVKISLSFAPQKEGLHKYTISLPQKEGELTGENNQRQFYVQVLKSKLKVLLISGGPGWELSFLRRALEGDANVEPTFFIGKKGGFYEGKPPTKPEELKGYDLVILQNCPRKLIKRGIEDLLVDYVKEGGALLMTGGERSFGRGGYSSSPLAKILPVSLSPREAVINGDFSPLLTLKGRAHPVAMLEADPNLNEAAWADLPPLQGVNFIAGTSSGAQVLAIHPTLKLGRETLPVIAVERYGQGKLMAITGFPLWRWDFLEWGFGKSNSYYLRFWSNAIRWLVTREEAKLVRITPSQKVYKAGERMSFSGKVFDENYQPVENARVSLKVRPKKGEGKAIPLTLAPGEEKGEYIGTLGILPPGDYLYQGEAALEGVSLGLDEGEFTVSQYSIEFEDTRMDRESLQGLALVSDGEYFDFRDAPSLPSHIPFTNKEIKVSKEIEIWDNPFLMALIVVILAAEWTIRKRSRML